MRLLLIAPISNVSATHSSAKPPREVAIKQTFGTESDFSSRFRPYPATAIGLIYFCGAQRKRSQTLFLNEVVEIENPESSEKIKPSKRFIKACERAVLGLPPAFMEFMENNGVRVKATYNIYDARLSDSKRTIGLNREGRHIYLGEKAYPSDEADSPTSDTLGYLKQTDGKSLVSLLAHEGGHFISIAGAKWMGLKTDFLSGAPVFRQFVREDLETTDKAFHAWLTKKDNDFNSFEEIFAELVCEAIGVTSNSAASIRSSIQKPFYYQDAMPESYRFVVSVLQILNIPTPGLLNTNPPGKRRHKAPIDSN